MTYLKTIHVIVSVIFLSLFVSTSQVYAKAWTAIDFQKIIHNTAFQTDDACFNKECDNNDYLDLIIVTRPLFTKTLITSNYLKWKHEKGFRVGVFTLSWIMKEYKEDFIARSIKRFIQTMHIKKGTEYAILIGDTIIHKKDMEYVRTMPLPSDNRPYIPLLPKSSSYIKSASSYPWEVPTYFFVRGGLSKGNNPYRKGNFSLTPSDVPYSSPDEFEMSEVSKDPQVINSELYGVIVDDISHLFSFTVTVYVSRMPVRDEAELEGVLAKTMNHKKIEDFFFLRDPEFASFRSVGEKCGDYLTEHLTTFEEDGATKAICISNYSIPRFLLLQNELDVRVLDKNSQISHMDNPFFDVTPNTFLYVNAHGNYHGIGYGEYGINSDDYISLNTGNYKDYETQFPVFWGDSCHYGTYWHESGQTLSEALIASLVGPVIVMGEPINEYFFFENILLGKTIGKAFYAGSDYNFDSFNPRMFYGDPTLILYNHDTQQ